MPEIYTQLYEPEESFVKSLPTVASGKNFSKVTQVRLSDIEHTVCRHTVLCSVFDISSYRISGCKEGKCSVWDPGELSLRSDYCLSSNFNGVEVSNQRTQGHPRPLIGAPPTFTTASLKEKEIQSKWLQWQRSLMMGYLTRQGLRHWVFSEWLSRKVSCRPSISKSI